MTRHTLATALLLLSALAAPLEAQTVTNRGFIEGQGTLFPEDGLNDTTRAVGDLLVRDELFAKPYDWLELAVGADLRANTHAQVQDEWRFDWDDRTIQRPRLALRRATATVTKGGLTLDLGKQFIRWGRADVLSPTDRFAPKDYLTVVNTEALSVYGVRPSLQLGKDIFEFVWVGRATPSRLPLLDQRWAALPAAAQGGLPVRDTGGTPPNRSQEGARWRHVGDRLETSLSFFNGINHIPNLQARVAALPTGMPARLDLRRVYPELRTYGADVAIPTSMVTLKGEAAYFLSPQSTNDEYVLYVIELERQVGDWLVDGGYAGESVITRRETSFFNPERYLAKSIVGSVSYMGDPATTFSIEGAVKQTGKGVYVKSEYSRAIGQHWRATVTGIGIAGDVSDDIGQYRNNSSTSFGLRYSF